MSGQVTGRFLTIANPRFRYCAQAFLLVCAAILVFAHVWADIYAVAIRDPESSHILLVPLVVGWLGWSRRASFSECAGSDRFVGLGLILLSFVLNVVGVKYSIAVAWHGSAVACLVGALAMGLGPGFFRQFSPALFASLFLIPVPGLLRQCYSLPLQEFCATISKHILCTTGMPVTQNGCVLLVNGTVVSIAEACTGVRIMMAMFLVMLALCYSFEVSRWVKFVLVLLSPVIAMLLNIVRLVATLSIYWHFDDEIAVSFHDVSGWVIPLAFILAIIYWTADWELLRASFRTKRKHTKQSGFLFACGTVALALIGPNVWSATPSSSILRAHRTTVKRVISNIPYSVGDWMSVDGNVDDQEKDLLKPLVALRRDYTNVETNQQITLTTIAVTKLRDLVGHEPCICFVGQGWELLDSKPFHIGVEDQTISGIDYQFEFSDPSGDVAMRAAHVMIIPGGESTGDMHKVAEAASDVRIEPFGAVTIQLTTRDQFDDQQWLEATREILQLHAPVVGQFVRLFN